MILDESIRGALNGSNVTIATAAGDNNGALALRVAAEMAVSQFNVTQDGPVQNGLRRTFNVAEAGAKAAGSHVVDPAALPAAADIAAPGADERSPAVSAPAAIV